MAEKYEGNAATKKAWNDFEARLVDMRKDADKRSEVLMTVGRCSDGEVNSVDDISKEIHLVTIPKDATDYLKGFTTIAFRIGDDIDDFEVLEEVHPD
jgi:hypothetical protein